MQVGKKTVNFPQSYFCLFSAARSSQILGFYNIFEILAR